MLAQRTIKTVIQATGMGLHSGQRVEMTLRPAPVDSGIVFKRIDLAQEVNIPARALNVTDTRLASTLSNGPVKVHTVEHLMSACAGLGIDNLLVELTAEEVPILDGSAAAFVFLFQSVGWVAQEKPRRFVRVLQTIRVEEGEGNQHKWAELTPYEGYVLGFEIQFANHKVAAHTGQQVCFDLGRDNYSQAIARARTFGFSKDVASLRAKGLGLGGGLDNAIVMDDEKVLNAEGLRYDNELVKHKILDAMGDLYLLGYPLLARYTAFRAGHALNNRLLRALLAKEGAFEYASFLESRLAPAGFAQLGEKY